MDHGRKNTYIMHSFPALQTKLRTAMSLSNLVLQGPTVYATQNSNNSKRCVSAFAHMQAVQHRNSLSAQTPR